MSEDPERALEELTLPGNHHGARIHQKLACNLSPHVLVGVGSSCHDRTGCGGDDQCRDLRQKTVTDRQHCVVFCGCTYVQAF